MVLESPDFDQIVTATRSEFFLIDIGIRLRRQELPGDDCRRPTHGITSHTMCIEHFCIPTAIVLELQNRDLAITGRTGQ